MRTAVLAGITFGLLAVPAAQAQKGRRSGIPVPQTKGFVLGAHSVFATGISVTGPGVQSEVATKMGGGGGIQIGYGVTDQLMLFASADATKQGTDVANIDGTMGLAHIEAGARMNFPRPGKRLVPYATGFVGKRALGAHSDGGGLSVSLRLSGTEFGGGGGFLYAFSPVLSLDAALLASHGRFSTLKLTGDAQAEGPVDSNSSTNFRLKVGFQWHP